MATYYIQDISYNVNASDNNAGTDINFPWATLQKAFDDASAGDTVYLRGGVWYPTHPYVLAPRYVEGESEGGHGHQGTLENPVIYRNYPGETPILDGTNLVHSSYPRMLDTLFAEYVHFIGITIRNVAQFADSYMAIGIAGWGCSNWYFKDMVVHDIGGRGYSWMCAIGSFGILTDVNTWINCDTYNCYDPYSEDPGNGGDGWKTQNEIGGYMIFQNCRAWNCSDDGFDPSGSNFVYITNCWAFNNGWVGAGLDGNGFKSGGVTDVVTNPTRIISGCISSFNKGYGFYDLEYIGYYRNNARYYNNISYKDGIGIQISANATYPNSLSIYKNNIIYEPRYNDAYERQYLLDAYTFYTESNNTWDYYYEGNDGLSRFTPSSDISVNAASFVALPTDASNCVAILSAARKSNGALPDVSIFHLTADSSLIYTGVYVDACTFDAAGNPWHNPPSLGPFEYTGNLYYVATDGSDSYPGTISQPWATWQRAVTDASPGDTVYIRGGVYYAEVTPGKGGAMRILPNYSPAVGRSGIPGNPIRYYAYPGETPILDCSLRTCTNIGTHFNIGIDVEYAQYIEFKGLTIRNLIQDTSLDQAHGLATYAVANLRFENCVVHDVHGRGFYHDSGAWNSWDGSAAPFTDDTTYYINCDAYNLFDIKAPEPGDAADGWKGHIYQRGKLYFIGCRAWCYSDDGFDIGGQGYRYFYNCWTGLTYKNSLPGWSNEGNGIKLTAPQTIYYFPELLTDTSLVVIQNCIAADCNGVGFTTNLYLDNSEYSSSNAHLYNNIGYKCYAGFGDQGNYVLPRTTVYNNNIAYASDSSGYDGEFGYPLYQVQIVNPAVYAQSNNTWIPTGPSTNFPGWAYNPDVSVTDADFISLDASELIRPRKADFSLPDISFGHLATGSDLIYAGIWVDACTFDAAGNPWHNPPSLGVFEYDASVDASTSTPTVTTTAITDISIYTATGGGNVTHDGSLALTYRGISWSTSINPTTLDASTTSGSTGEGSYVSYLTGLNASTHYHIRAFAYNSQGISYGIDVSFNTLAATPTPAIDNAAISYGGVLISNNGILISYDN